MASPDIYPTDIMIIVHEAWHQSFSQVELNKRAIAGRGKGPLNYNLLNDTDVKATMTDSEHVE